MCGICGIFGVSDKQLVKRMCDVIIYRGPDGEGFLIDNDISLGMRRLSIIDLFTGNQPIHNEDEAVWVIANCEIYNYRILREELSRLGHKFYTKTDTETIVHLYEEYGEEFVTRLRGMFAFAIWDAKKKKLVLGRDRLGIKPLYYTIADGKLIFGSEIKSILQYEGIKRILDSDSLASLLSLYYTPGENTLFKGIKRLPPGYLLSIDKNGHNLRKYWELTMNINENLTEDAVIKTTIKMLTDSVNMRLMSDVPLGATLSAGVDSTSVVALMSKLMDEPVKTITVGFGEPDDEFEIAQRSAEYFGTDHSSKIIDTNEIVGIIPKMIWHQEEITNMGNEIPTYYFSQLAKERVTVFLLGEGGDELFAGYGFHRYFATKESYPMAKLFQNNNTLHSGHEGKGMLLALTAISRLPVRAKTAVHKNIDGEKTSPRELRNLVLPDTHRTIVNKNPFKKYYAGELLKSIPKHPLNRILNIGLKEVIPNFQCLRTDKLSMAHSTEARVPFLDHEFVEFISTIPAQYKVNGLIGKYILKKSFSNTIPKNVIRRKKTGLRTPTTGIGNLEVVLDEIYPKNLSKKRLLETKLFNYEKVLKLMNKRKNSKGSRRYAYAQKLFLLLNIDIWHRIYIQGDDIYHPNLDINKYID